MRRHIQFVIAQLLFVVAGPVFAADRPGSTGDAWRWNIQAGAVHQFEASLDDGGDMSASRYFVSAGAGRLFAGRWRIGATLGYGQTDYDFSGNPGFEGSAPWNRVRDVRFSAPIQYFANKNWSIYAIPTLRFNAESDAALEDGMNGGILAGAAYRVNEKLTIGPGLGIFSEIEDSTSFFPLLIIDWKISDTLSLETGGGFAASRGPGLQLRWRYSPRWQLSLGGRYEKVRFRLDDTAPAPDGVGEDKSFPLFAVAEYTVAEDMSLSLVGGAETGASLRLEDSSGRKIYSSDLSTAPFLGAVFQIRF